MFRVTRRRMAAAALIAGAMLTSACAPEVGAAAVVDGKRIDVATVQDATSDLELIADGLTQTDVLGMLIIAPLWSQIGSEHGVGFTDQEVQTTLDAFVEQLEAEPQEFSQGAIDVLRSDLILTALLNGPDRDDIIADIQQRIAETDIEANPRFGNFTTEGGLQPTTPVWLVDSPANP